MKATLLGFTVTDQLVATINAEDPNLATQTHRFAWGVVQALRSAGVDVDLLSSAPVSDYPRNPHLIWRGASFTQHGVRGYLMPFVNTLVLKQLSRALSARAFGLRILIRRRPEWILVHGVHTPFLWFALRAARQVGARVCVFVTDPPGVVLASDGGVRRLLKRIDIGMIKSALSRADALVVLAEPLARDFAPGVKYMVMEGLYDPTAWREGAIVNRSCVDGEFVITYAGGLNEAYGVVDLVNAVRASDDPRLRLQLYGRGSLEGWLTEQARADRRIDSPKLLAPEELSAVYASSDVLVQPRPVAQAFVPYSFPSKLIEYLASGTPVITTRLPSIPEDYDRHVVWSEDGVMGLEAAIRQVHSWSPQQRREFGWQASRFMVQTRSTHSQGRRVREFLAELEGGDIGEQFR